MQVTKQNDAGFSLTAYQCDAKTLLAITLSKAKSKSLAGFTIQVKPDNQPPFYLQNNLRLQDPAARTYSRTTV
jgi:hypothetical protein